MPRWAIGVIVPLLLNLGYAVWHGGALDNRVETIDGRIQRIERLVDALAQKQLCPTCK